MSERSPGTTSIPLSFNQDVQVLGDWMASLRGTQPPRSSPHCAYYWEGALDLAVLQQAIDALVARHEALRTAFPDASAVTPSAIVEISRRLNAHDVVSSSLFTATVSSNAACPLRVHDELLGKSLDDPAVIAALQRAAIEPLRDGTPPQLRVSAFRLTPTSGVLLMGMHHLITDNWSVRLIQKDLGTLYRRFSGDADAALPTLTMQYSDFSAWQRRRLVNGELADTIAYWSDEWREFFPGRVTLNDLPLSRPTPPAAPAGATEVLTIGDGAYRAIRDCARRAQVTSYTFWLSALTILFHVYSGKTKIAFFGNTAGRTLAETEHVLGWFANSSLIGMRVSAGEPALDLLQHVRDATLQAQQREDLPLGALWGTFMKDGRFDELSRGDWIAMNFGEHRRIRVETWGVDGLFMRPFDLGLSSRTGTALNIGIMNRGDRFVVSGVYHADRFAADDIRRLLGDLQRVTEKLVADPYDPVHAFAGVVASGARAGG
jgi:hypothetical protein